MKSFNTEQSCSVSHVILSYYKSLCYYHVMDWISCFLLETNGEKNDSELFQMLYSYSVIVVTQAGQKPHL